MKSWKDIGFEIEITGDGSPSLHLLSSVDPNKAYGESMHHSGGACSETNLIYGQPISEVFKKIQNPEFMVVGLGLGYIEMVIAREALLAGLGPLQIGRITSYESVPELRHFFIQWLHSDEMAEQQSFLLPEVFQTYDLVLQSVLLGTAVAARELKSFLCHFFKSTNDLQEALLEDVSYLSKYHCILYDAFSSKTTPHLWAEDFLNQLLHQATAVSCVLTTYACRGSLKRALKNQGFEVVVREGFQGKRNSTLALRNLS